MLPSKFDVRHSAVFVVLQMYHVMAVLFTDSASLR